MVTYVETFRVRRTRGLFQLHAIVFRWTGSWRANVPRQPYRVRWPGQTVLNWILHRVYSRASIQCGSIFVRTCWLLSELSFSKSSVHLCVRSVSLLSVFARVILFTLWGIFCCCSPSWAGWPKSPYHPHSAFGRQTQPPRPESEIMGSCLKPWRQRLAVRRVLCGDLGIIQLWTSYGILLARSKQSWISEIFMLFNQPTNTMDLIENKPESSFHFWRPQCGWNEMFRHIPRLR